MAALEDAQATSAALQVDPPKGDANSEQKSDSRAAVAAEDPVVVRAESATPAPRVAYSPEVEAYARSRGLANAAILEENMTHRCEFMMWIMRNRPGAHAPPLESMQATCGGDKAMARRVLAAAKARVSRHVAEGTRPTALSAHTCKYLQVAPPGAEGT